MVISWILHSVSPNIAESVMFRTTAAAMWKDFSDRSNRCNGPRVFQLRESAIALKQGNQDVQTYFARLKVLWDEFAEFYPTAICTYGAMEKLNDFYNLDQVLQFLTGLNESYHPIRVEILLLDPLPNISKVFSMVIQEESQQTLGFTTIVAATTTTTQYHPPRSKKPRPFCTHCNRPGHLIDKCYFLHGFPPGYGAP
ncbi:uncharacterized protein LOC133831500 [Humulus lupulus]|uniref:uncharacterized protein LOC133831500 n=1 Tax=Humulus lupulus TaxID=3486 RepID=UPI002B40B9DE|nr:uncharacterized protein LOC133831500 [Humulus lupulus]